MNSILDFHYYLECEGVPKFLGEMAMLRDAYFPKGMLSFLGKLEWGVPKFLGKIARGCKFFRDSIFPVTPDHFRLLILVRPDQN